MYSMYKLKAQALDTVSQFQNKLITNIALNYLSVYKCIYYVNLF